MKIMIKEAENDYAFQSLCSLTQVARKWGAPMGMIVIDPKTIRWPGFPYKLCNHIVVEWVFCFTNAALDKVDQLNIIKFCGSDLAIA